MAARDPGSGVRGGGLSTRSAEACWLAHAAASCRIHLLEQHVSSSYVVVHFFCSPLLITSVDCCAMAINILLKRDQWHTSVRVRHVRVGGIGTRARKFLVEAMVHFYSRCTAFNLTLQTRAAEDSTGDETR